MSTVEPSNFKALVPAILPVTVTTSVASFPSVTAPFAITAPATVKSSFAITAPVTVKSSSTPVDVIAVATVLSWVNNVPPSSAGIVTVAPPALASATASVR